MKVRSIGYLLALAVASQVCLGQTTTRSNEKASRMVLVRVLGAEVASQGFGSPETHLSERFVVSALRSASTLRDWQNHLSITIQNGYPPSDYWIGSDRDRAADALRLASLAASTEADREVLQQLSAQYATMEAWSTECLDAYKNLRMARYYMSSAALQNDETFQHSAQCTQTLLAVLSKGEVTEQPMCR